jgi:hypothetical protein
VLEIMGIFADWPSPACNSSSCGNSIMDFAHTHTKTNKYAYIIHV